MAIAFDTMPLGLRNSRRLAATSLLNRIQKEPLLERLGVDVSKTKPPSGPRGAGPTWTKSRGTASRSEPKKPKTAEELDNELDAFMGDSAEPAPPAPAVVEGDVDMA